MSKAMIAAALVVVLAPTTLSGAVRAAQMRPNCMWDSRELAQQREGLHQKMTMLMNGWDRCELPIPLPAKAQPKILKDACCGEVRWTNIKGTLAVRYRPFEPEKKTVDDHFTFSFTFMTEDSKGKKRADTLVIDVTVRRGE